SCYNNISAFLILFSAPGKSMPARRGQYKKDKGNLLTEAAFFVMLLLRSPHGVTFAREQK
ncbi:MAG: hypothetical protein J6V06_01920, partial [Clostridia bacterium]|nr:hypothetical protein [Clostridia bacterium]